MPNLPSTMQLPARFPGASKRGPERVANRQPATAQAAESLSTWRPQQDRPRFRIRLGKGT
jgi:hypothetical protein